MNGHPRRVIALTVVGILVMAGLVGGGWWLGQRGDRQPAAEGVTTAPPTSPPAPATTAPATPTSRERVGTWQRLPAAPIPTGSYEFAGVWTGRELLLYGAVHDQEQRPRAAGAAYNPTTRTWRRLPAMPEPRADATATWTGSELLVVGGRGPGKQYADGVAYNPATNRWRRLPAMESSRIGHTAVWTGNQLLVWGGQTRRAGSWTAPAHGLAYDPASNRWSALPRSPLRGRTGHAAVWTGTQMLIWGGYPARQTDPQRPFTDGAAYTPYPL